MANPNISNVSTVVDVTTAIKIANANNFGGNVLLSNAAASGAVYKVNSIIASNVDGSTNADVSINYMASAAGVGHSYGLCKSMVVTVGSNLVVIGKDSPIYLTENTSLCCAASAADDIDVMISYESYS